MKRLIKKFSDCSLLEYDDGRFDEWCIYHSVPNEPPSAIKDVEIFTALDQLGQRIGSTQLYRDFLSVYQQTDRFLSPMVLQLTTELAGKYRGEEKNFDFLMTCLYAGMVAEENKEGAILRKRIKRLGVHQLLVEERPPTYAANFSRGRPWRDIVIDCEIRGF